MAQRKVLMLLMDGLYRLMVGLRISLDDYIVVDYRRSFD